MQEDDLEELRKGFIEAIAAHKFMQSKFGSDRSIEINKLKQKWTRIKQIFTVIPDLVPYPNPISSKYQDFELQLLKLQGKLESTKTQLLEQQRITNNLIRQNSMALKQIKELSNYINIPPTLEHIDYSDLNILKNLLDEL
ncbi:hypothetical protein [Nostoc sp.]|uniref:hypothetical protein n=1 Tax=Nostoc sp. TaxID=1180 RepID=UPI002FFCE707